LPTCDEQKGGKEAQQEAAATWKVKENRTRHRSVRNLSVLVTQTVNLHLQSESFLSLLLCESFRRHIHSSHCKISFLWCYAKLSLY
jgi:hypothetical protein